MRSHLSVPKKEIAHPSSAIIIAGANISPRDSLLLPNASIASTQEAAHPKKGDAVNGTQQLQGEACLGR